MGRKKCSFGLSAEGIQQVTRIRMSCCLTIHTWACEAYVSPSTAKRFIQGKPISPENFRDLCKVLGIEEWQSLIDREQSDSTAVDNTALTFNPSNLSAEDELPSKAALAVTGIFTSAKRFQVEMSLEHFKQLLINGKVIIKNTEHPDFPHGCFVHGLFTPDQQLEMEVALEHLKQLLVECTVTILAR